MDSDPEHRSDVFMHALSSAGTPVAEAAKFNARFPRHAIMLHSLRLCSYITSVCRRCVLLSLSGRSLLECRFHSRDDFLSFPLFIPVSVVLSLGYSTWA